MSGAFMVLLGILIVSALLVGVFMVVLRRGTFAKVEDVHERLAKEREEQGLPTAVLNRNGGVSVEGGEPVEAAPSPEAVAQSQPQPQPEPDDQPPPAR